MVIVTDFFEGIVSDDLTENDGLSMEKLKADDVARTFLKLMVVEDVPGFKRTGPCGFGSVQ
jgi:hypothetical protein